MRHILLISLAIIGLACSSEDPGPEPPIVEPEGCQPGELTDGSGACLAPGIDPEACGDGFEPDGARGCRAILPADACAPGTLAIPGSGACAPIAECGTEPFAEVPAGGATAFVDQSYTGESSDGTIDRPFKRVGDALAQASPGTTILVAAGTYQEDLVLEKPDLRVVGRCPELVEIRGTGARIRTITIGSGASGATLEQLAVTGPHPGTQGIWVDRAENVVLERVWIHGTQSVGLLAGNLAPTSVTLQSSLIEDTAGAGAVVSGAALTVEGSVIRNVRPAGAAGPGIGIFAYRSTESAALAEIVVRRSLIEDATNAGLVLGCATAELVGSVVRRIQGEGEVAGGVIALDCDLTAGAELIPQARIIQSQIDHNGGVGILALGADLTVDATIIADTHAVAERSGAGLVIGTGTYSSRIGNVVVSRSLIERATRSGIAMQGGTLDAQRIIVRDTAPSPHDGISDGVFLRAGEGGEACGAVLRGALIEQNGSAGVFAIGADARLENASIVRSGWGAAAYYLPEPSVTSQIALIDSQIVESTGFGVIAVSAGLELTRTQVRGTKPSHDDRWGDGVNVTFGIGLEESSMPTATLRDSVIEGSARAGLSTFGADVSAENTLFSCNAVQINGESDYLPPEHHSFRFDDAGGNICRCGDATQSCEVVIAALEPPELGVLR